MTRICFIALFLTQSASILVDSRPYQSPYPDRIPSSLDDGQPVFGNQQQPYMNEQQSYQQSYVQDNSNLANRPHPQRPNHRHHQSVLTNGNSYQNGVGLNPPPRPNGLGIPRRRPRYTARPGNVIVHFNRNHDIQRVQYVLQDGGLAMLYDQPRHQSSQDSQMPIQIQHPDANRRRSMGEDADESIESGEESDIVDPDETIDVVDSKLQGVSQLIGNHMTVAFPHTLMRKNHNEPHKLDFHESKNKTTDYDEDEKLDVIATVAVDMLEAGASVGQKKAKKISHIMMKKIKERVNKKLKEMPDIVAKKLAQKSSIKLISIDQDPKGQKLIVGLAPGSELEQKDVSKLIHMKPLTGAKHHQAESVNKPHVSARPQPTVPTMSVGEASPNVEPINSDGTEVIDNDDGYLGFSQRDDIDVEKASIQAPSPSELRPARHANGPMLAYFRRPLSPMMGTSPSIPMKSSAFQTSQEDEI